MTGPTQVKHDNYLEPTPSTSFHRSLSPIESTPDDHDYSQPSCSASVKRQLKFKPCRRLRPRQEDNLSNRLINLSEETLLTLKSIDKNTESIAECLKVIACVMKDRVQ